MMRKALHAISRADASDVGMITSSRQDILLHQMTRKRRKGWARVRTHSAAGRPKLSPGLPGRLEGF